MNFEYLSAATALQVLKELDKIRKNIVLLAEDINASYHDNRKADQSIRPIIVSVDGEMAFVWERDLYGKLGSDTAAPTGFNRAFKGNFAYYMSGKQQSIFIDTERKLDELRIHAKKVSELTKALQSLTAPSEKV